MFSSSATFYYFWVKSTGMITRTSGIVLHQLKYSDSGIIIQAYTEKLGRISLFVRGTRNKKTGRQVVHLQPLSILDLIFYYRESRSMQTLKEFSVDYMPADIHSNLIKSSMALFLGEVLLSVLREESPQGDLFAYLKNSIVYLDTRKEGYANFHIALLAGLCSYLGFEPGRNFSSENQFFDMVNGAFVTVPPSHGNYTGNEISSVLAEFFNSSWDNMNRITLTGSLRNEILEAILKYYSIHLPSLKKIKSLDVLREVFG